MKKTNKICVFGSANADYFLYVHQIPAKGQTIQAQKYMTANGGKGANQAVAVAKLAGKSWFIGQVGNDDAMQRLKKEMESVQVQVHWRVVADEPTGMAYIYVDQKGENSIVIYGGANMKYKDTVDVEPAFKEIIKDCDYLLLQKEIPMSLVEAAAIYANSLGKTIILDCGGQDDPISETILNNITYISPNETQLKRINPTISIPQQFHLPAIAQELREKVLAKHTNLTVLLKLGSKGSAIITSEIAVKGEVVTTLNPNILKDHKIIDTVGAGDCLTGAFAVKHSQLDWSDKTKWEDNYLKAMSFGNSSAFICITRSGAMPSMPFRKEVDQFMHTYHIN